MFIEQYYISKKVCDDLVKFFNNTDQKGLGYCIDKGKKIVNKKIKNCIETSFVATSELPEFVNYRNELIKVIKKYQKKWPECVQTAPWGLKESVNLQYYPPGGGYYKWHAERHSGSKPGSDRHLVFMTYLNDVTDAGETEFKHQKLKVKPKKGKTLIWPSDWTFTHRGVPSKTQDKYIMTGWLSFV